MLHPIVNNAGVAVGGDFVDIPAENWRWILAINLRASDQGRRDAELMMDNTAYTLDRAATDILDGVAARRFYVLAPSRLRVLWLVKRLAPMVFLRLLPRLRERQFGRMRGSAR